MASGRYLSREAPILPLPTCNSKGCACRYLHHDDRRSGEDRRYAIAMSGPSNATGSER